MLITELPLKYVRCSKEIFPPYHPSIPSTPNHIPVAGVDFPVNELVTVEAKEVKLGKPADFPTFGWDNEYGQRSYQVGAFRASKFKISNGEFLEFVNDSGYNNVKYWSAKGWEWRSYRNIKWPVFWVLDGPHGSGRFRLRVLCDEVTMPWDWPVVVNLHEASAFIAWKSEKTGKSLRLLTELEHNAMRGDAEISNDLSPQSLLSFDPITVSDHQVNSFINC